MESVGRWPVHTWSQSFACRKQRWPVSNPGDSIVSDLIEQISRCVCVSSSGFAQLSRPARSCSQSRLKHLPLAPASHLAAAMATASASASSACHLNHSVSVAVRLSKCTFVHQTETNRIESSRLQIHPN